MQGKLVKKVAVRDTFINMEVGEEMVVGEKTARYTTIYPTIKRIEKKTNMRFEVTMRGVVGGTRVKRLA
jgi:hypothetical protein